MGRLILGHDLRLDLDDRTLAHLHLAMKAKLRRGESFHLSWRDDPSIGDGRTTVWVHPEMSMVCKLSGPVEDIDRVWLDQFINAANSVAGLSPLPEPTPTEQ